VTRSGRRRVKRTLAAVRVAALLVILGSLATIAWSASTEVRIKARQECFARKVRAAGGPFSERDGTAAAAKACGATDPIPDIPSGFDPEEPAAVGASARLTNDLGRDVTIRSCQRDCSDSSTSTDLRPGASESFLLSRQTDVVVVRITEYQRGDLPIGCVTFSSEHRAAGTSMARPC
jgi:hypothetical protein